MRQNLFPYDIEDARRELMEEIAYVNDRVNEMAANMNGAKDAIIYQLSPAHLMAYRLTEFHTYFMYKGTKKWVHSPLLWMKITDYLDICDLIADITGVTIIRFEDVCKEACHLYNQWKNTLMNGGNQEKENRILTRLSELEAQYGKWKEEQLLDLFDELISYQLKEQEEKYETVVFKLRSGNETKVWVRKHPFTGILHVLDLDEEGTTSLTNAIEEIRETLNKTYAFSDILLYHTDGLVSQYQQTEASVVGGSNAFQRPLVPGRFIHVSEEDGRIYRPFHLKIKHKKWKS